MTVRKISRPIPRPDPPRPNGTAREARMQPVDGPSYSAEKARGGEIILRTPARRIIFVAGLACIIVLVLLLGMFVWRA